MSLTAQRPMNDVCATRPDGRNYFKRKQFSPVAASGVLLQMGSWREPPAGEEVEGGHWVAGPALAAGGLRAERLSSGAPPGDLPREATGLETRDSEPQGPNPRGHCQQRPDVEPYWAHSRLGSRVRPRDGGPATCVRRCEHVRVCERVCVHVCDVRGDQSVGRLLWASVSPLVLSALPPPPHSGLCLPGPLAGTV